MKDNTVILMLLGVILGLTISVRIDTKEINKKVINIENAISIEKWMK